MLPKFRAFYKPDLQDGNILPFYLRLHQESLMFVMEEPVELEERIAYYMDVPFTDSDWIVHRWVGFTDSNGNDIWENDLVEFEYAARSGKHEGIVMWCDKYKHLGIKSFSRESDTILPFFNFMGNSGELLVKTLGLYE